MVVVDRGTRDGLALGDVVEFHPRGGRTYRGTVTDVRERSATVELHEDGFLPEPGTRGEVQVPASRLAPEETPTPETPPETPPAGADRPAWENADEGWRSDMPLLARVRGVTPEDRTPSMRGRVYVTADQIFATDDDRSDTYARVGGEMVYENPFGRGGTLHVDGEVDYQILHLPDDDDESGARLRLDRLSYAWGGSRYDEEGWEAGRFLQRGMPEFGVLDGVEWGQRLANGDRWGASLGYLPEPDPEMATAEDLQAAAYYHWVSDLTERFSLAAGYQKTLHNGDSDRDLLVTKARWAPERGWNAFGTAWIDFYGSGDDVKSAGVEVTQAIASVGHRWDSGNGIDLTYRRQLFPEIEREEFPFVDANELEDGHHDRLALDGWRWLSRRSRLHGGVGAWIDEDDSGGDAEIGMDVANLLLDASRTDITLFGQAGEFTTVLGARTATSRASADRHWSIFYELAHHHNQGFGNDRDDILQHRLRGTRDFGLVHGWRVSCYVETMIWDDEGALMLGAYVQKDF
jgi:hypothetical protein